VRSIIKGEHSKRRHRGQEAVEWWLIVSVISFVVMFSLVQWGNRTNSVMNTLMETLNSVNTNINTST
jgi:uncharacterized Rmd1/YagE family protein